MAGAFRPGQRIGPYTLLEAIAQGGQGALFKARDHLGREVALKVLLSQNPRQVQRFVQEARVLARLDHPNLPKVFGVAEEQGVPCLAMELVAGEDLKSIVGRTGPDPALAVEVLGVIARVLEHCHGHEVVHRDLKPHNILIEVGSGRPVLVDFGLARPLGAEYQHLSRTGETLGTPAYMAPEQCDTEFGEVGPQTDVYGLGAVLYFLLTGQQPFTGGTTYNVILKVIRDSPPDPRGLNPAVPESLARLCQEAMSKVPAERPASASKFREALEGRGTAPTTPARANWAWVPLVLVPLLLLLGGVSLWVTQKPAPGASAPAQPAAPQEPTRVEVLVRRGQEREERKEIQGAIDDYRQVIGLAPRSAHAVKAITRLVNMCEKNTSYLDQAEAACRQLLKAVPRHKNAILQLGDVYRVRGQYDAAFRLFDKAIEIDREYYWAYVKRGEIRGKKGDHAGARADFRLALQLDATKLDAEGYRAWRNLANSLYYGAQDFGAAIEPYTRALRLKPRAVGYRRRAWCYYVAKRFDEAIADCTRAIELEPEGFYQRYYRGKAYMDQLKSAEAIADFEVALELAGEISRRAVKDKTLDPKRWVRGKIPRMKRYLRDLSERRPCGLVQAEVLRLHLAMEYLDPVVLRLKTNGWARLIRAQVRGEQGDVQGALADYRRAMELEPGARTAAIKGLVNLSMEHSPDLTRPVLLLQAEQACRWLLGQQPGHVEATFKLGDLYKFRRFYDDAIKQYDRTIQLDANHSAAYVRRGWLRREYKRDLVGAIADYRAVTRIRPKEYLGWRNLGDCLYLLERWREALGAFDRALGLLPRSAFSYRRRGWCHYQLRDLERAAADLTQAVELEPGGPWQRYFRGLVYVAQGKSAKAIADFERALQIARQRKDDPGLRKKVHEIEALLKRLRLKPR